MKRHQRRKAHAIKLLNKLIINQFIIKEMTRPILFIMKYIILLLIPLSCLFNGCISHQPDKTIVFTGKWQGSGVDSKGTKAEFVARITSTGSNKYQILILKDFADTTKPMHVMDGVLDGCVYSYTSDNGIYSGKCELTESLLTGYYKGPIDGTFTLHRIEVSKK